MSTPPRRSLYADAATARRAIAMAMPMIEAACADRRICGAGFGCIVVLDAAVEPSPARTLADALLVEQPVGERARWDADYAAYARAKAEASWRTGVDGEVLQTLQPQRLAHGDSLLTGAVWRDGLVVAFSGAMPWWDHAFATAVAANVRALAQQAQVAAREAGMAVADAPPLPRDTP